MKRDKLLLMALTCSLCMGIATPSYATTAKDLVVGINTFSVLIHKIKEPIKMAIIYDEKNTESVDDANRIMAAFKNNFKDSAFLPPKNEIISTLVSAQNLDELQDKNVAFLARGLSLLTFKNMHKVASKNKILTMSSDLECVKTNNCVLGIVSRPQVEVYYSSEAAKHAGIVFFDIFTMLSLKISSPNDGATPL